MTHAERAERNAEIIRRYQDGESARSLAPAFGLKANAIKEILERAGIPRRSVAEAMALAGKRRWAS